jgi:hypothetical protein
MKEVLPAGSTCDGFYANVTGKPYDSEVET